MIRPEQVEKIERLKNLVDKKPLYKITDITLTLLINILVSIGKATFTTVVFFLFATIFSIVLLIMFNPTSFDIAEPFFWFKIVVGVFWTLHFVYNIVDIVPKEAGETFELKLNYLKLFIRTEWKKFRKGFDSNNKYLDQLKLDLKNLNDEELLYFYKKEKKTLKNGKTPLNKVLFDSVKKEMRVRLDVNSETELQGYIKIKESKTLDNNKRKLLND